MTFDEALQQHKDNLTKNLSQFGEGHRLNRLHKEIDSNAADYEYYFNAGQQSQQAKVEELQKRVDILEGATEKTLAWFDQKYVGETGLESMLWVGKAKEARDGLEQALKGEG